MNQTLPLSKLPMFLLVGIILLLNACQTTGGGKVVSIGGDGTNHDKISTDLDLNDFKYLSDEVARKMLTDARLFSEEKEYRIALGSVRNLTDNEHIRASDLVDMIKEALLQDPRIRITKDASQTPYVMNTDLKSITNRADGKKRVDYVLRFELFDYLTQDSLGSWSATRSYMQGERAIIF